MVPPTGPDQDTFVRHTGVAEAELDALLELLAASDVRKLSLRLDGVHIQVQRSPAGTAVGSDQGTTTGEAPPLAPPEEEILAITAPLVGIFHPSVAAGTIVAAGQTVGAIQALGIPTSVDSPRAGLVDSLLAEDAEPVEFGQPLLLLRPGTTA